MYKYTKWKVGLKRNGAQFYQCLFVIDSLLLLCHTTKKQEREELYECTYVFHQK
jgi:hypothetical protein